MCTKKNVAIIGAGSWGVALSILLANNSHNVKVWSCFKEEVDMLNNKREHEQKLKGIKIPSSIYFTTDINESIKDNDIIVIVLPSQVVRQTCKQLKQYINKETIIVCCSKGLEQDTGKRLTEVIKEEIPNSRPMVLYGPSHAEEVAMGIPTTVVSVSNNIEDAKLVQNIFMSDGFRVYTNTDLVGAEIGAALKNVIALCAGISDGLGYGDNTKAALMTRGITEIARLGKAMGAKSETFLGLTGIGDLIVTCTSMHSRNRRAGILIGQGMTPEQAQQEVKMVVEGVTAAKAAYQLAKANNVELPITEQAYNILFKGMDSRQAVSSLMTRSKKKENEEIYF